MSRPPSTTTEARFWAKVDRSGRCWLWTAATHPDGYGKFRADGRVLVYAHRWSYESLVGPIPEGLTLDHLCRTRNCVNPEHLEPVTNRVNILRGESPTAQNARLGVCPQGHAYDEDNTSHSGGGRRCRTCVRERSQRMGTCEPCGLTMYRTNLYAHRRTAKHLATVA